MKINTTYILAIVAFALSGCVAQPTLAELETEAMVTGDWTQFDRKNKRNVEREKYASLVAECDANNLIPYCEIEGTKRRCGCTRR